MQHLVRCAERTPSTAEEAIPGVSNAGACMDLLGQSLPSSGCMRICFLRLHATPYPPPPPLPACLPCRRLAASWGEGRSCLQISIIPDHPLQEQHELSLFAWWVVADEQGELWGGADQGMWARPHVGTLWVRPLGASPKTHAAQSRAECLGVCPKSCVLCPMRCLCFSVEMVSGSLAASWISMVSAGQHGSWLGLGFNALGFCPQSLHSLSSIIQLCIHSSFPFSVCKFL